MSSKINVSEIISGHFNTLKNSSNNKINYTDIITFIILPLLISGITVLFGFKQSDQMSSLLVNFGAIFTALLLSVLVLVYDQGNKLTEKLEINNNQPILKAKQNLLKELYYNICYSIVVSVGLVFLCLIEKALRGRFLDLAIQNIQIKIQPDIWFFSPLIVFFTINLMLTILMIVKRMHTLLTTS
jgi:hypothetical protein